MLLIIERLTEDLQLNLKFRRTLDGAMQTNIQNS